MTCFGICFQVLIGPVKHRDTTKTTKQNPHNGDQRNMVHSKPRVTHRPSGIPVKHRDTTKTTKQNPQNGDQRTVVYSKPRVTHRPTNTNHKRRNYATQLLLQSQNRGPPE